MIKISIQCEQPEFSLRVNEEIPSKGITAIFGRSGAGKTMLINAISGLISPNLGSINMNDMLLFDSEKRINISPEKRSIGYVFQDSRLFPHMTVQKNLRYAFKGNTEHFNEIVSLLDIAHLLKRYPKNLSGGEKQRVAIGRALLSSPKLLIMDEPTASLDSVRRAELIEYLLRLTQYLSIPVIYISHHLEEVMQLADHMLILENGSVVANGEINQVWHLASMQPWFLTKEHSSLLYAKVSHNHKDYKLTALSLGSQKIWIPAISEMPESLIRIRVFSADVSIAKTKPQNTSIRNLIFAKVVSITEEATQSFCYVTLDVDGQYLVASITTWAADELALVPDMMVFAQLKGISIAKKDISLTVNKS